VHLGGITTVGTPRAALSLSLAEVIPRLLCPS
jgi:hypothetical protein